MDVRAYLPEDREACLAVFDSNVAPGFFTPAERAGFARFLDQPVGAYLVLEHEGRIIGCGGYRAEAGHPVAGLSWGMIQRDLHRQGLGRYLLLYRMKEIGRVPGVTTVELRTTPEVAPFFEKYAFRVVGTAADGAGLVEMRMKLQVCA
jgi:N-acetylglutamate synthase-like GNAT family acetyltransferase